MGWILTEIFSKVVIILLVLAGLVALTLARLRRRLRVSPSVRSDAPLTWIASPVPAARLHRRLQHAVAAVRAVRGPKRRLRRDSPTAVQRLADDVERESVATSERLLACASLGPSQKRTALNEIAADVRRIEQLAHRVVAMAQAEASAPQLAGAPTALDDLAERVDRIQQAHVELAVIDTTAGLGVPPTPPALEAIDASGRRENR